MFGHKRKVLINVPRISYKGPGKHTRGERIMTGTDRIYSTEGSSALVPSYPTLTLIEGGAARSIQREAPRSREENVGRARISRIDALTVAVCTLMVFAALLAALFVSRAVTSSRFDAALASIPAQEVVVETGDSVWGLAAQYPVKGYSTSELAKWITEKNSLGTSALQPGQVLMVPASD